MNRKHQRSGLRRKTETAAALVAVGLVGAACSGGHKAALPPPTSTTSSTAAPTTTTSTTTPPPATYPLTGLPATNPATLNNPAVVVKIDNVDAARPQTGVDSADVVYEAEVEGGLTRLAAVFQSTYPADVGPVRSGRLTDEGVADDLNHPVLAFAGANSGFLPILQQQPATIVDDLNYPNLFQRVGSNIPHNLFANVAALAGVSKTHTPPPPLFAYLPAGHPFGGAGAAPAAGVSIVFPAASAGWAWNAPANSWLRTQNGTADMLSDGHQVAATNVVLYFVPYISSGMATGEGLPPTEIPEGILTGQGTAWFFAAGQVVKGTWHRPSLTTPATYTDASGAPVALPPGKTWVELVPDGASPSVTP